jgi:hypothetical protein
MQRKMTLQILFTITDNTGLQEAYPFVEGLTDWKATILGRILKGIGFK